MTDKVTLMKSAEQNCYDVLIIVLAECHEKHQAGARLNQPELQASLNNWAAMGTFIEATLNPPASNEPAAA